MYEVGNSQLYPAAPWCHQTHVLISLASDPHAHCFMAPKREPQLWKQIHIFSKKKNGVCKFLAPTSLFYKRMSPSRLLLVSHWAEPGHMPPPYAKRGWVHEHRANGVELPGLAILPCWTKAGFCWQESRVQEVVVDIEWAAKSVSTWENYKCAKYVILCSEVLQHMG